MVAISLRDVNKTFRDGSCVLSQFDLEILDGELIVLVGPSGSGKTTILRMIAGLEAPSSGAIFFDNDNVAARPAGSRNVAMVFQDGALFNHMSVRQNIAFPLRVRRVSRREVDRRVTSESAHVGVTALLAEKPSHLSAGHRHSVATARALIRQSEALLLDEPLASLDAGARQRVRSEVVRLHRELGTTTVYVTNDTAEAMAIGERVGVMDGSGRLRQVSTPTEAYRAPTDTFVAGFLGPINLTQTRLQRAGTSVWMELGTDRIRLAGLTRDRPLDEYQARPLWVGIRPEHLTPARPGAPFDTCVHGRVRSVSYLGAWTELEVSAGTERLVARADVHHRFRDGDPVELALDTDRLLFFDHETGKLIGCR